MDSYPLAAIGLAIATGCLGIICIIAPRLSLRVIFAFCNLKSIGRLIEILVVIGILLIFWFRFDASGFLFRSNPVSWATDNRTTRSSFAKTGNLEAGETSVIPGHNERQVESAHIERGEPSEFDSFDKMQLLDYYLTTASKTDLPQAITLIHELGDRKEHVRPELVEKLIVKIATDDLSDKMSTEMIEAIVPSHTSDGRLIKWLLFSLLGNSASDSPESLARKFRLLSRFPSFDREIISSIFDVVTATCGQFCREIDTCPLWFKDKIASSVSNHEMTSDDAVGEALSAIPGMKDFAAERLRDPNLSPELMDFLLSHLSGLKLDVGFFEEALVSADPKQRLIAVSHIRHFLSEQAALDMFAKALQDEDLRVTERAVYLLSKGESGNPSECPSPLVAGLLRLVEAQSFIPPSLLVDCANESKQLREHLAHRISLQTPWNSYRCTQGFEPTSLSYFNSGQFSRDYDGEILESLRYHGYARISKELLEALFRGLKNKNSPDILRILVGFDDPLVGSRLLKLLGERREVLSEMLAKSILNQEVSESVQSLVLPVLQASKSSLVRGRVCLGLIRKSPAEFEKSSCLSEEFKKAEQPTLFLNELAFALGSNVLRDRFIEQQLLAKQSEPHRNALLSGLWY